MVVWRRLDIPGHEACRLLGRTLEGTAVLAQPPSVLSYRVICDESWRTQSVRVSGWIESRAVDVAIEVIDGRWILNGAVKPALDECVDVDLNFSPSTNTLPIRRLALAVGDAAEVRAAWLRFPELTLERLDQTYRRTGERTWQYTSDDFAANVEVDDEGLVRRYEGLWEAES